MSRRGREIVDGGLSPGQLFADRYQIEELLGRGGMGAVYRARDLSLGEGIALKVLFFGEESPGTVVLRFRQEVRLARRVTHPNVARVYDIGEHEGTIYMTMELIDGVTLRSALRADDRFDPVRAARIARAVCEGLAAAHASGVIHRDLKPANVLLDRAGRVVIADFGIARSLLDDAELTSGVIGTPLYMAPEQVHGGRIDPRTDLYAVGVLLHEMLTGSRPDFQREDIAAGLAEEDVPPALAAIVLRCLERDPAARPGSADEVAQLLEQAVPEAAADPPPELVDTRVEVPAVQSSPSSRLPTPSPRSTASPRWTSAFATEGLDGRALAVLPFRYRGAPDHAYLGDAIADELIDVLSRTRGLRVLASGATAAVRDVRDPRAVGRELSVVAIVDGTVQMAGERVRITAQLIDVETGVQLWSDHYECSFGDLIELQQSIARRVAEALRVELHVLTHGAGTPDEAIERYLTARRRLRTVDVTTCAESAADLARSIELAPAFAPAYAAHAMACVRSWIVNSGDETTVNWERAARGSVSRALARAPDIAESHLAAAMLATQEADFRSAARALARALSIAPTCAEAHEHLGMLQCEAGQGEAGVKRMELADQLNPTLPNPLPYIARHLTLHRQFDAMGAVLREMERRHGKDHMYSCAVRTRMAGWRGDSEALRRFCADKSEQFEKPHWRPLTLYVRGLLGEISEDEIARGFARLLTDTQSPRFITFLMQFQTELHAGRGEVSTAMLHLLRAATSMLIDLEWLDRCPLLDSLRGHPDFGEARRRVRARAEAIWAT